MHFCVQCFVIVFICFSSCNNKPQNGLKRPTSVSEVKPLLVHKKFVVEKLGFVSEKGQEADIRWMEAMGDSDRLISDFVEDNKRFSLDFVNDSVVNIVTQDKTGPAKYTLEQGDTKGLHLVLRYEIIERNDAGAPEPMYAGFHYTIKGLDEKNLLLQAPLAYDNRIVVYLMKELK